MPNRENCSLLDLQTAAKAAPIQRTNLRLMAIKALTMAITHEQVAVLFGVNEDSVSRWIRRFNLTFRAGARQFLINYSRLLRQKS